MKFTAILNVKEGVCFDDAQANNGFKTLDVVLDTVLISDYC